ncbi:hypothetical protein P154DRAFT_461076 [Amniculicola lignicola CBS 123094]|uniref:U1-type domain-containing protein n=1 Tax=Amniculicola lignicola CBS 123094 TaxID=1392246 RepID=A0A6A5WP27_9PLEO|nr:hypothetical protein P154DRAFT_461076 [Amniculicola lignicola CBS 123094]
MADYWKSTPNYWCKFCDISVRDTKFDRRNHDATPKHQNNIQRHLRRIHKEQEQTERDTQRAKAEVARLNGLVPSSSTGPAQPANPFPKATPTTQPPRQRVPEKKATLGDRKKQWDQLLGMGIAVPQEARPDLAVAGEWQVVSQRVINEDTGEGEMPATKGVHKRKLDEEEEEAMREAEMVTQKKGWGHDRKMFKSKVASRIGDDDDDDLEALFSIGKKVVKQEPDIKEETGIKDDPDGKGEGALHDVPTAEEAVDAGETRVKKEDVPIVPTVVFKKRKKIAR